MGQVGVKILRYPFKDSITEGAREKGKEIPKTRRPELFDEDVKRDREVSQEG